jgi:arylsulfatase A-like enzyme
VVDNTIYDAEHADRFTLGGKTLMVETAEQMKHYQTNMACLLEIGRWCEQLREMGVYDNTKIIIAADHGYSLRHSKELLYGSEDMGMYFPLLLVKDFDSHGFSVSDEFMTNADVPTLATQGTIENPINPFTGKRITSDEKTAHDQFISLSHNWGVENNNGTTYTPSKWAAVTSNIWDRSDWTLVRDSVVLNEHKVP